MEIIIGRRKPPEPKCEWCKKPLPPAKSGYHGKPMYCGRSCREKLYRHLKKLDRIIDEVFNKDPKA